MKEDLVGRSYKYVKGFSGWERLYYCTLCEKAMTGANQTSGSYICYECIAKEYDEKDDV